MKTGNQTMIDSGCSSQLPAESSAHGNQLVPLRNLSTVQTRIDSLRDFLADSIKRKSVLSNHQMDRINSELTSAIYGVIVNGASLLALSQPQTPVGTSLPEIGPVIPKPEYSAVDSDKEDERIDDGYFEIVEIDAVELLAEHIHFCEICGKGFKRDANLRMHMRAHGNQFKTVEALAKPGKSIGIADSRTRFSCPYVGCNRNKQHKSFRPLKSAICVKNHFKRSHCPKMYSCNRCHKKSFSVMADLKSHLKHCGDTRWRCSCGSTFSRKDKLFGHIALFEGHMPAIVGDEGGSSINFAAAAAESTEEDVMLFEGFGSLEDHQCLEEMMMIGESSMAATSVVEDDFSMTMVEEYLNFKG